MEEPRAQGSGPRVLAGIDEAGLGPLLGPLTVGWSALLLPPGARSPWQMLAGAVARDPARAGTRTCVADSKRLFDRSPAGARRLERTALAFLAQLDPRARPPLSTDWMLSGTLGPRAAWIAAHPWYASLPERLPVHDEPAALADSARDLARALAGCGAAVLEAGVRLVPVSELNQSLAATGNKAESLLGIVLSVLRHLWDRHGAARPTVICDRQGGRRRYAALLAHGFPEAELRVTREDPELSEYRLDEPAGTPARRRMRVVFATRADARSFPVALASCLAKYARETEMLAFNRYFGALQPGLRPTAGYVQDGRRWMAEAGPALARAALARGNLVRSR